VIVCPMDTFSLRHSQLPRPHTPVTAPHAHDPTRTAPAPPPPPPASTPLSFVRSQLGRSTQRPPLTKWLWGCSNLPSMRITPITV
jgi:hypothetical protein